MMKSLRSVCLFLMASRCHAFSPNIQILHPQQNKLSPLQQQPSPITSRQTRRSTLLFSDRVAEQGEASSSSSDPDSISYSLSQQAARTERINQVVLLNGLVVGSLALSATYHLLHTHVEALWALYDYGLGKVDSPEITYLTVTMETLLRMPLDLIGYYQQAVESNPIFYKACTSGVAYCLG